MLIREEQFFFENDTCLSSTGYPIFGYCRLDREVLNCVEYRGSVGHFFFMEYDGGYRCLGCERGCRIMSCVGLC